MLQLVKTPSEVYVKAALGCLTTTVNLAHNCGWAFNKFMSQEMFNLAALLDPRPALLAGPAWYEAAVKDNSGERLALLGEIERMDPIDVKHKAPAGKTVTAVKTKPVSAGDGGCNLQMKAGVLPGVGVGGTFMVPEPVTQAQAKAHGTSVHVQLLTGSGYWATDVTGLGSDALKALAGQPTALSMAGSSTVYRTLGIHTCSDGSVVLSADAPAGEGGHVLAELKVG
jgi:hypothetical protein